MASRIASDKIVEALELAVLEKLEDGGFLLRNPQPGWLVQVQPGQQAAARLEPGDAFPPLSSFLRKAEKFWTSRQPGYLRSSIGWDQAPDGGDYTLEASALRHGRSRLLLLERPRPTPPVRLCRTKLARLGHELRTPLNALFGFTSLLAEPETGSLNDRQRKYVANLREAAQLLLAVIDDVLPQEE